MNRREFLKLLALGVVGHTLDVDQLLWVPGQKKIFLPNIPLSLYGIPYHHSDAATGQWLGISRADNIIAIELERIAPMVKILFEKDDTFYAAIKGEKK